MANKFQYYQKLHFIFLHRESTNFPYYGESLNLQVFYNYRESVFYNYVLQSLWKLF